ncbi:MAG TPA: amidohydrolase family protein [Acidimicrobiales bacterium]|jgi:predicted TIM-barrel fold metal-dependent hydrolase
MLTDDMDLISVDDHLVEHRNVWRDRLPARLHEAGPRVVEHPDGREEWLYEGRPVASTGLNAVAGTELKDRNVDPQRFDQMRPAAYDPVARLDDMDADGVAMQLCFPTLPGFAGRKFYEGGDKALGLACVRAYNDFVLDEWCATAPDRYIPLTIMPLWDPELAAAEIERCATKGTKALGFPDNPYHLGLPSVHTDHWSPVFAAAQEAQLPLCCHFGGSGFAPTNAPDGPHAALTALFQVTLFTSITEFVYSPTFHRFPDLKVVFSEGSIGWLPYAMQRLDQVWEHYRFYPFEQGKLNPDVKPSDLMRRNVFGCFIDDPIGLQLRHEIGVDNILYESDYPHADSLWPHSRKHVAEVMVDVPDDDVRRIVETNARRLFRV